jgi:hypothetical protein
MTDRANTLLYGVWGGLVVATVASWLLGDDHGVASGDVAVVAVLVITFTKIWLVGLHFMELRHAPAVLRRAFEGYVVVVPVALAALYLSA